MREAHYRLFYLRGRGHLVRGDEMRRSAKEYMLLSLLRQSSFRRKAARLCMGLIAGQH